MSRLKVSGLFNSCQSCQAQQLQNLLTDQFGIGEGCRKKPNKKSGLLPNQGGRSPFYEVISQKIFYFMKDGFPYIIFFSLTGLHTFCPKCSSKLYPLILHGPENFSKLENLFTKLPKPIYLETDHNFSRQPLLCLPDGEASEISWVEWCHVGVAI